MLIAVVQAVIVLVFSAQSTVEAQAVTERLSALSNADQWLSVATADAQADVATLGAIATAALHGLSANEPVAHLTLGALSDRRFGRYQLIASSSLKTEVRLLSGRWPSDCNARRCEVLSIGSRAFRALSGLVVVGKGEFLPNSSLALGLANDVPLLLAADPPALLLRPGMAAIPHTMQWLAPLDASRIHQVGISPFIEQLIGASDRITLMNGQLQLVAPTTQLAATASQVEALKRRMLGLTLCLVLITIFSVHRIVFARRRDHDRVRRLIHELGWSRMQQLWYSSVSVWQMVVVGMAVGSLCGTSASLLAFGVPVTPSWELLAWSTGYALTLHAAASIAQVSNAVGRSVVLAAVAAIWIAVAVTAGYDLAVLALAALGALIAAVAAHVPLPPRLGLFALDLWRANTPRLRSLSIVSGFLVALVLSSVTSLGILRQGLADHAIFESPLAARVVARDRLPLQDHSAAEYSRLSGGGTAYSVRTISAAVRADIVTATPTEIIAVDPAVWASVPDLQGQIGISNQALASATRQHVPTPGIALRAGHLLSGQVQGLTPTVTIAVWLLDEREEAHAVTLQLRGDGRFRVDVTPGTLSLLGFSLIEQADAAAHRAHAIGEGTNTLAAPQGVLLINHLAVDGTPMRLSASLLSKSDLQSRQPGQLEWKYTLIGGEAWASLSRAPAMVFGVVDPLTARAVRDGVLAVRLTDATVIPVRVTAVAQRLPSAKPQFILLDPRALKAVLAQFAPEMLRVSEVWIDRPLTRQAQSSGALVGLAVTNRTDISSLNAASSATFWSERMLELLSVVALVMYFAFVWFSTKDLLANANLEGWAAQGQKRNSMHRDARQFIVGLLAISTAVIAGILLAAFPLVLVRANVDLSGAPASPPLHAVIDFGVTTLILSVAVMLAGIAATLATSGGIKATHGADK